MPSHYLNQCCNIVSWTLFFKTYFSEILTKIQQFSLKKKHLKMLPEKRRPFCLGLNVLKANEAMYRRKYQDKFIDISLSAVIFMALHLCACFFHIFHVSSNVRCSPLFCLFCEISPTFIVHYISIFVHIIINLYEPVWRSVTFLTVQCNMCIYIYDLFFPYFSLYVYHIISSTSILQ